MCTCITGCEFLAALLHTSASLSYCLAAQPALPCPEMLHISSCLSTACPFVDGLLSPESSLLMSASATCAR